MVLGGIAYLFVGGSSFFNDYNSAPVVVYRQVNDSTGTVAINGSIVMPTACHRLDLDITGDVITRVLNFVIKSEDGCALHNNSPVPETFLAEFVGDNSTTVRVIVDSVEQKVILK